MWFRKHKELNKIIKTNQDMKIERNKEIENQKQNDKSL